ncbi:uncharacterized protein LOC123307240 [Coccinella septempunctata]|uniref:uncharacterized protein LOC123307240 n=1 Tax=Coccinella septempunctata TaxID=41139 RepID=UPI001D07531C|nr:uncharacterized protein LOC123307240 [Coccinella septempunctata]
MARKKRSKNWSHRKTSKFARITLQDDATSGYTPNTTSMEDSPPSTPFIPGSSNIVRGSRCQDNDRFSSLSRNNQCTAIAAVALAYNKLVPFKTWNYVIIDNILDYGDCLYKKSITVKNSRYSDNQFDNNLMVIEVYPKFIIGDVAYILKINDMDSVTGCVEGDTEGPFFTLADGLEHVFLQYESAILTCGLFSTCVSKKRNHFFLFDSHSRGPDGRHIEHQGTACLIQFHHIKFLLSFLSHFYNSNVLYTLVPVEVQITSVNALENTELYVKLSVYDGVHSNLSSDSLQPSLTSSSMYKTNDTVGNPPDKHMAHKSASDVLNVPSHYLGEMNYVCLHCGALFFQNEIMFCCSKGAICLPANSTYPELLKSLITGNHSLSKEFLKNIRKYNTLLALASTTTTLRTDIGHGSRVVVVSGQIHHRLANINTSDPKFGSLYFIDSAEAKQRRSTNEDHDGCDENLLEQLDALLRDTHPFTKIYRNLGQVVKDQGLTSDSSAIPRIGLYFNEKPNTNMKIYAAPTTSDEIGAVFSTADGDLPPPGQIRIYYNQDNSDTIDIPKISPIGDTLCYPLLFPNGEYGWFLDCMKKDNHKRVSMREFICYRLMIRLNQFNPLVLCGRLTQQYIVDKFVQLETQRLNYLRVNQAKLRADNYIGLQDYIGRKKGSRKSKIGRVVILPSSYTGSPRFMRQNFQDAMAIQSKLGRPSLFITFTCNPKWPEITDNLGSSMLNAEDRPELIARIFELKRKALFEDILKNKIFGTVRAYVYVIEFHKRGLPHLHCLLTLSDEDKPRCASDVDELICAELPTDNPRLLEIILTSMIHGPCGKRDPNSPCMVDGYCSKYYPKSFSEMTLFDKRRPTYRRRNDGRKASVERNCISYTVDNRDVVPYNPYLCEKYNCHINVEYVTSVGSVKNIFQYMNKESDAALLQVKGKAVFDEIQAFLDSRYISSGEAAWRLLGLPIQGKSHSILRLPVHLPGERTVQFEDGEEEEAFLNQQEKMSLLEAFFELNINDPEARKYKYCEIPIFYTFNTKLNRWTRRVRTRVCVISRMYSISPKYVERFHLRTLLLHVSGPKSFAELRTVDGITYSTFQQAARARHLVVLDDEWENALAQAALIDIPSCLRKLFVFILCYCEVGDPPALWTKFKQHMSEDFRKKDLSQSRPENDALHNIQNLLGSMGKSLEEFKLPLPLDSDINFGINAEAEELNTESGHCDLGGLNSDQRRVFDRVIGAIDSDEVDKYFYLQGSSGTGKTHLYNTILSYCSSRQIACLAVAFTGIAALLLKNGKTVHSAFKLPLDLDGDSRSSIMAQSQEAAELRKLQLIIWDEVSMANFYMLDAVDRLLQDVCNDSRPFGGKCVLLGGDVKQLLPVATDIVRERHLFFTNCMSWSHFKLLKLTINMRANKGEEYFASWLELLGSGSINENRTGFSNDSVQLPAHCLTTDVVGEVYGELKDLTSEQLSSRAILCPKNEHCDMLNDKLLESFPGSIITCLSNDSIASGDEDDMMNYPEEFLNTIAPGDLPIHELKLKVGVPVILLRNLSLSEGLINGTRLLVLAVTDCLLTAKIVTGRFSGRTVFVPRIDMSTTDETIPFVLKRRQFPVRICFALTINEAQGQTFDQVGIYLETPVFAHGQLYVAFSRVRCWNAVKVQVVKTKHQGELLNDSTQVFTKNIVFKDILDKIK